MSLVSDFDIGRYAFHNKSAAAADYRYIPVGRGLFKANLSLYTDDANASPYSLAFRYKDSKGVYNEVIIISGLIQYRNYAHVQNVEFEGPGDFMAYLLPANAPSAMNFAGYIRRIQP